MPGPRFAGHKLNISGFHSLVNHQLADHVTKEFESRQLKPVFLDRSRLFKSTDLRYGDAGRVVYVKEGPQCRDGETEIRAIEGPMYTTKDRDKNEVYNRNYLVPFFDEEAGKLMFEQFRVIVATEPDITVGVDAYPLRTGDTYHGWLGRRNDYNHSFREYFPPSHSIHPEKGDETYIWHAEMPDGTKYEEEITLGEHIVITITNKTTPSPIRALKATFKEEINDQDMSIIDTTIREIEAGLIALSECGDLELETLTDPDDIAQAYYDCVGGSSCMCDGDCPEFTRFYGDNGFTMCIWSHSLFGDYKLRHFIVPSKDGTTLYVTGMYTESGDYHTFRSLVKENIRKMWGDEYENILISGTKEGETRQPFDKEKWVPVSFKDSTNLPYIDDFIGVYNRHTTPQAGDEWFLIWNGGGVAAIGGGPHWYTVNVHCTEGGDWSEGRHRCMCCGEGGYEEDMIYIEDHGSVCQYCADRHYVYSDWSMEYYEKEDVRWSEVMDDWIPHWEAVEVLSDADTTDYVVLCEAHRWDDEYLRLIQQESLDEEIIERLERDYSSLGEIVRTTAEYFDELTDEFYSAVEEIRDDIEDEKEDE